MSRSPPSPAIWACRTDQGTWVITSFAVPTASRVPLTGWLMQRYGVVRTFVLSVLAFTVASFLCGVAWSLPSLIVFRVLQGAVSGPMIPGSQALLLIDLSRPRSAGTALGDLVDDHAGGADLRPDPGRLYLRQLSLAWIFLINVPVGVLVGVALLAQPGQPRDADAQAADRHGGPGPADRLGRRAAGHAGQGQGPGLVRLHRRSWCWPS